MPHKYTDYRGRRASGAVAPEIRFWEKVEFADDCWEWLAATNPYGYGAFSYRGRGQAAHRVAWMLVNGPIPEGLCVLHKCDNPPCVKPDHLFLGTRGDNLHDAMKKGRWHPGPGVPIQFHVRFGEAHSQSKLTEADVLEIRRRTANGERPIDVAEDYPVKNGTISAIHHRRLWKHLEREA